MAYVEVAGASVYYEVEGEESAPGRTILFAHGAGGNAGIWFHQVEHFTNAGFRCITFDHRTFARTHAPLDTVTPTQFRDDALAILDVNNVPRAHFVGQSMGGFTALRVALDAPERVASLTMSATPGGLPNNNPSDSARNLLNDQAGSRGVLETMSKKSRQDPILMRLYAVISGYNTEFSFANLGSLRGYQVTFEEASALQMPVLFVAGNEDPLFPKELLQSYVPHIPGSRCIVVEDSGHSPYYECPAVFNELLAEHIASVDA